MWQSALRVDGGEESGIVCCPINHHFLHHSKQEGEHEDCINRFHAESPAQDFDGEDEEDDVYEEESVLYGEADGVENHGTRTGETAGGDFVGQHEAGEAQRIEKQTGRNDDVVTKILKE